MISGEIVDEEEEEVEEQVASWVVSKVRGVRGELQDKEESSVVELEASEGVFEGSR